MVLGSLFRFPLPLGQEHAVSGPCHPRHCTAGLQRPLHHPVVPQHCWEQAPHPGGAEHGQPTTGHTALTRALERARPPFLKLRWALLLRVGFLYCAGWGLLSSSPAQEPRCTGSAVLQHVGPCWATEEPMSSALRGRFQPLDHQERPWAPFLKVGLGDWWGGASVAPGKGLGRKERTGFTVRAWVLVLSVPRGAPCCHPVSASGK